jgi:hypothetical protein
VALSGVLWQHFLGMSDDNKENSQTRRPSGQDMKYGRLEYEAEVLVMWPPRAVRHFHDRDYHYCYD